MRSDHRAPLLRRRLFTDGLFSLTFSAPNLASQILPGQFVMLDVPGRVRPYLRRAYSVADAEPTSGGIELLVRTIGAGTAALEELSEGSYVFLFGPLGNGFGLGGLREGVRVAVIAGGIGAAPFPFLFRGLGERGIAGDFFFGGRGERDLALLERFEGRVSGETFLATDDGSAGEKGFITEAFRRRAPRGRYARLYACGPMPMLNALAPIVEDLRLPSEFSTEAEMGCGFGACLACVIPGKHKAYIVSCTEGPILSPTAIDWERISPSR